MLPKLQLGRIRVREITPTYTFVSYYNQKGWLDRLHIGLIIRDFVEDLVEDLSKFSIYDEEPPKGMDPEVFGRLMKYKAYSRQGLTGESLKERLDIMLDEFKTRKDALAENKEQLKSREEKIERFYKQDGNCNICSQVIELKYVDNERAPKNLKKKRPKLKKNKRTMIDKNGDLVHISCPKIQTKKNVIIEDRILIETRSQIRCIVQSYFLWRNQRDWREQVPFG